MFEQINYYLIGFLLLVLPYSYFSIKSDLKSRKISNIITLSFLYISFVVFIFFLKEYDFNYLLALIFTIVISYFFFKKDIWGGADGKIFISLTFLILALGHILFYLDFVVNLLIFYSISIILIVIFKTNLKQKITIIKNTDYHIFVFQILLAFIFLKNILRFVMFKDVISQQLFLVSVVVGFIYLTPYLRDYFHNFSLRKKISLNIILFIIFVGMSYNHLISLVYFIFILFFRISLDIISNLTLFLKDKKGEKYYSPFSVYLFISAIFTMVFQKNIVDIIVFLFKLF